MTDSEFKADVLRRLVALETHKEVDAVHRSNVEKRLSGIESNLVWLIRIIGAALVMALLSLVFEGRFPGA